MEIAARHHLIELQKRLDVFLTERFGEIINTDGFLNIAGDRLMRLLTEHKVSRQVRILRGQHHLLFPAGGIFNK